MNRSSITLLRAVSRPTEPRTSLASEDVPLAVGVAVPRDMAARPRTPTVSRALRSRGTDVRLFGPFRLDVGEQRLWRGNEELKLRRKPFAILRFLTANSLRLATQEEVVEAVWGKIAMSESLLRTHMSEVRRVLGEGAIETVVGRGYRFLLEVETETFSTDRPMHVELLPSASNLVGRGEEMAVLQQVFEAALGQRRQIVFVTGDPGIGKTALSDAFLAEIAAPNGALIARGSCIEQFGTGEAYLPVLAALGAVCRGPDGERIIDLLGRHAPTWLAQMPGLVRDENLHTLQLRVQGATQARMLRELAEAFDVIAAERPLVLVLEDMQWSDRSTTDLVALLGARREPARLLVIATCRPAELTKGDGLAKVIAELRAHKQALTLQLETLSEPALAEYLTRRFPDSRFPETLPGTIQRMTGGNPLFAIGVIDDLESRGMIRQVGARWQLEVSVADVASRRPDTVRQLIDIQIDRLSSIEQRTLEVACLVGAQFAAGSVAHALELPADEIDSVCEGLANERRLLEDAGTQTWPDGTIQSRYAFRHALFQHAALARTTAATVRTRHRKIAERLETGYFGHEDEVAGELAVHFELGQMPTKAGRYHVVAGERAARRCGYKEAAEHLERARALLEGTPESRDRDALELRVSLNHGWSVFQANGRMEVAIPLMQRAKELAGRLEDRASLGEALVRLETIHIVRGDLPEASKQAGALAPVLEHLPDAALRLLAKQLEATTVLLRGHFAEAHRLLGELGVFRATDDKTAMEAAHAHLLAFSMGSFALWLMGEPDRAVALSRRAQQVTEQAYDPFDHEHVAMLAEGALLHAWRREPGPASELAQRALAISEKRSFAKWQGRAELILRWAEAELAPTLPCARVEELLSKPWENGSVGRTMHAMLFVAMCERLGRAEPALEVIASTLATIERTDERWLEPELHRLRGEVLKAQRDTAEAERSMATAIEIARKQGSRSLELRATLSLHALASGAKKKRAREDIARLLSVITEGHDTPDLLDARAVVAS
jgi:predicted ATPase/DNA-binding winged helix-turn-helix (wHTH) protein